MVKCYFDFFGVFMDEYTAHYKLCTHVCSDDWCLLFSVVTLKDILEANILIRTILTRSIFINHSFNNL